MLGTVTVLRRYPVKSMLGEELDAAEVSRSGLARDRRLAVVSRQTGKVASAKYPRLWRDMLTLSAEALDDAARITLPDGKTVSSTDPGVDEVLSAVLGQPVTLTDTPPPGATLDRAVPEAVLRDGIKAQVAATLIEIGAAAPPGTFVDFAPLHLITTATLDRIAELSPYRRVRLERYRPNVVIRTEAGGFTENDWLGRDLHVGDDLVLRVIARTPAVRHSHPGPRRPAPRHRGPPRRRPAQPGQAAARSRSGAVRRASTPKCCARAGSRPAIRSAWPCEHRSPTRGASCAVRPRRPCRASRERSASSSGRTPRRRESGRARSRRRARDARRPARRG